MVSKNFVKIRVLIMNSIQYKKLVSKDELHRKHDSWDISFWNLKSIKLKKLRKRRLKSKVRFFIKKKAIRFKFDFQTLRKLLQIMTNNVIGQNKVKTVCWWLAQAIFFNYIRFFHSPTQRLYQSLSQTALTLLSRKVNRQAI